MKKVHRTGLGNGLALLTVTALAELLAGVIVADLFNQDCTPEVGIYSARVHVCRLDFLF